MMEIRAVRAGGLATLEWNGEIVQVVEHWGMCAKIRSLRDNSEREVSLGTPVSVCAKSPETQGQRCACGCERLVVGKRSSRRYATNACRVRVAKRGNAKEIDPTPRGNANTAVLSQRDHV